MTRSLIIGGTGRLGQAVGARLRERGDEVFSVGRSFDSLPDRLNYVAFCQRYRGMPDVRGEFEASALLTHEVLDRLGFADEDCSVVIVSSVHGTAPGAGQEIGYHLGKAAAIMLAQYHAVSFGLGVRVNAVSPFSFTGKDPLLRMDEVVNVIEFLASPQSSGISGQNIVVDKGSRAWRR